MFLIIKVYSNGITVLISMYVASVFTYALLQLPSGFTHVH